MDEAIRAYSDIVQHRRASADVYWQLAVLYDKTGQLDQSARYYLAALQREPNNAQLLSDYGYSRCVQGDLAVAEQTLRRALAADPQLARAHNNLGIVLARRGQRDEALAEFVRAGCTPAQARSNYAYALIPSPDGDPADADAGPVPPELVGPGVPATPTAAPDQAKAEKTTAATGPASGAPLH